jgi:hypothetical protein
MKWRISSHNSGPCVAAFRPTVPNGVRRAAILGSATKDDAIICHLQSPNADAVFCIVAPLAGVIFLAFGGFGAPSRVWPVAALTPAASSILVFGFA